MTNGRQRKKLRQQAEREAREFDERWEGERSAALIGEAVVGRWPICPSDMERFVNVVMSIGTDKSNRAGDRIKAAAVFTQMVAQNQRDEHAQKGLLGGVDVTTNVNLVSPQGLLDELTQHPAFVDAARSRLEDGDTGSVGGDDQRGEVGLPATPPPA